nr:phosphatidylglycerol lysyltransferase domain-containing protein [Arthrobacter sp. Hiyo1]
MASASLSLKDEGCDFLSLSGAPLARIAEDPNMPPPEAGTRPSGSLDRLLDWLGATLEPVYGFRSLLAFKAKSSPGTNPSTCCTPTPRPWPPSEPPSPGPTCPPSTSEQG